MEKQERQIPKIEEPKNLDDLLIELFTPEFLESLEPKEIETVINNLKLVESSSVTIPTQWSAIRNALEERGYLE